MAIQYAASFVVMGAAAVSAERLHVDPVPEFWFGLLWSVFGLSIGAVFLLLGMIRRGAVVGVAAWMFLVPPVAAAMNHLLFGEALLAIQVLGVTVAVAGVALATRA
jgi:drug/metabolite transporter (DMT)-like permease